MTIDKAMAGLRRNFHRTVSVSMVQVGVDHRGNHSMNRRRGLWTLPNPFEPSPVSEKIRSTVR